MSARELIDKTRLFFVKSSHATTRDVTYVRASDNTATPLPSFISGVDFHQYEDYDKKADSIICRSLTLEQEPAHLDKIIVDGKSYKVRSWERLGQLYTVHAEHNKRNAVRTRNLN